MSATKCQGGHQGHLCVLASEERWDEVRRLVRRPRYVCFNCGRAAASRKSLCNPMPLKDTPPA